MCGQGRQTRSGAGSLYRARWSAVRILHVWTDHVRQSGVDEKSKAHGSPSAARFIRQSLQLWKLQSRGRRSIVGGIEDELRRLPWPNRQKNFPSSVKKRHVSMPMSE